MPQRMRWPKVGNKFVVTMTTPDLAQKKHWWNGHDWTSKKSERRIYKDLQYVRELVHWLYENDYSMGYAVEISTGFDV